MGVIMSITSKMSPKELTGTSLRLAEGLNKKGESVPMTTDKNEWLVLKNLNNLSYLKSKFSDQDMSDKIKEIIKNYIRNGLDCHHKEFGTIKKCEKW